MEQQQATTGHNDPFDTDVGEGGETVPADFDGDACPHRPALSRTGATEAASEARIASGEGQ